MNWLLYFLIWIIFSKLTHKLCKIRNTTFWILHTVLKIWLIKKYKSQWWWQHLKHLLFLQVEKVISWVQIVVKWKIYLTNQEKSWVYFYVSWNHIFSLYPIYILNGKKTDQMLFFKQDFFGKQWSYFTKFYS